MPPLRPHLTNDAQLVVQIPGDLTIRRFNIDVSAAAGTSAAQAVIPPSTENHRYVFRLLLCLEGPGWFRIAPATGFPTPWINPGPIPFNSTICPPAFFYRIPAGDGYVLEISAASVAGPPAPFRVAGWFSTWESDATKRFQGA